MEKPQQSELFTELTPEELEQLKGGIARALDVRKINTVSEPIISGFVAPPITVGLIAEVPEVNTYQA
jgi:hypothetical protein